MGRIADVMRGADADEALFEIISRGCDYERAVESALETGEIKGRNASIDELQAVSLDDDGLPHPAQPAAATAETARRVSSTSPEARCKQSPDNSKPKAIAITPTITRIQYNNTNRP